MKTNLNTISDLEKKLEIANQRIEKLVAELAESKQKIKLFQSSVTSEKESKSCIVN